MLKEINALAKKFNSSSYQIGIAQHFKYVNKWTPAIFYKTDGPIAMWDASDSPEEEAAYRNDIIDGIHIFLLEDKNNVHTDKYRKPSTGTKPTREIKKRVLTKSDYFN